MDIKIRKILQANLPAVVYEKDKTGADTATPASGVCVITEQGRVYYSKADGTLFEATDLVYGFNNIDELNALDASLKWTRKIYITADNMIYIWTGDKFVPVGGGSTNYIWLDEVPTHADIASTYPAPTNGNAVVVTVDETYNSKRTWYRYVNDAWEFMGLYFGETAASEVEESRAEVITASTDYTIPVDYYVAKGQLAIFMDGIRATKGVDYVEIGTDGSLSTTIQFLYDIPTNTSIVYEKRIIRTETTTPFRLISSPVGSVIYFASTDLPDTYLPMDGSEVSRSIYSELFAKIGTTYGAGDGSTTFNLPDPRGRFIRVWDDGVGVDADRVLGSVQEDAIRNITGYFGRFDDMGTVFSGPFYSYERGSYDVGSGGGNGFILGFDASRVVPTANENRPKNIAFLAAIKYKAY